VLVLTFTLICSLAYFAPGNSLRAVTAQSKPLSGPFGFLLNASSNDPTDSSGTGVLGVMNFDGAGNVTGTYTLQNGGQPAQTAAGTFTGTNSSNPDGSGSVTITLDVGVTLTFATVVTDGGQGLQLVATNCSRCGNGGLGGGSITLQGTSTPSFPLSFSGALDISLFFSGATGTVPLSVSGAPIVPNGSLVYKATGGTGSGPIQCDDGSTGTWTSSVPSLTFVAGTNNASAIFGDFLLVLPINACGGTETAQLSGLITGNFGAAGALSLVLHGNGGLITGIARAAYAGGSLNGSYGIALNSLPQPAATVGVMVFDGAGNVTVSKISVGPPGTGITLPVVNASPAATYSLNPDGSGTLTLTGATFAFVATDGGSGLLLLQTSGTANGTAGSNVTSGTARMQ